MLNMPPFAVLLGVVAKSIRHSLANGVISPCKYSSGFWQSVLPYPSVLIPSLKKKGICLLEYLIS